MRIAAWILAGLGVLIGLLIAPWYGYGLYVQHVVARSPATMPVVDTPQGPVQLGLYEDGAQVVPTRPAEAAMAMIAPTSAPTGALPTMPVTTPDRLPVPTGTPTPRPSRPILPPTRLQIDRIGVDVPVVLADNDNIPKFKAAGWYVGSGYPGFRGNVVLFGRLAGDLQVFARLGELAPDDRITVRALEVMYVYTVTESQVVPADSVEVLRPSGDTRLTLITSAGDFDAGKKAYSHRLVVTAMLDED